MAHKIGIHHLQALPQVKRKKDIQKVLWAAEINGTVNTFSK